MPLSILLISVWLTLRRVANFLADSPFYLRAVFTKSAIVSLFFFSLNIQFISTNNLIIYEKNKKVNKEWKLSWQFNNYDVLSC